MKIVIKLLDKKILIENNEILLKTLNILLLKILKIQINVLNI